MLKLKMVKMKRDPNPVCYEMNNIRNECTIEVKNIFSDLNDLRTLYVTTWKLTGIRCNQNRPIRNEDRKPLTRMEDQLP